MSIAEKLTEIKKIKQDIRDAIVQQGGTVSDDMTFRDYVEEFKELFGID